MDEHKEMELLETQAGSKEISRRQFLGKSGKVIALGALAHFTMLGSAQAAQIKPMDVCNGNLEYVPGLDKCGVQGTPDEPGCGLTYWACYIIGHRPE